MNMTSITTRVLIAGAIVGCISGAHAQTPRLSVQDRSAILRVVATIKAAIVRGRTDELLRAVSPTLGLTCTGTNYSYQVVAKFLSDRTSVLYRHLFDSVAFARACAGEYPDVSEREFLGFGDTIDSIAKLGPDWVEVSLVPRFTTHSPRVWSLHRESGTWKLADGSLTIGQCSCA